MPGRVGNIQSLNKSIHKEGPHPSVAGLRVLLRSYLAMLFAATALLCRWLTKTVAMAAGTVAGNLLRFHGLHAVGASMGGVAAVVTSVMHGFLVVPVLFEWSRLPIAHPLLLSVVYAMFMPYSDHAASLSLSSPTSSDLTVLSPGGDGAPQSYS